MVDEAFVLRFPTSSIPRLPRPALCAGITTYSPLRHWNVKAGQKVGVVGLGGLGHMGLKFAHAFGAHVVLFTTSPSKTADAMRLGADEVVVSKDEDGNAKAPESFDFILDTVSATRPERLYQLLKRDGAMTLVGAPPDPPSIKAFNLLLPAAQLGRLAHRRDPRDAGDARFLRRARHRLRHRDDPDPGDQRGLRAHAQERREIPLRHRHGLARVGPPNERCGWIR